MRKQAKLIRKNIMVDGYNIVYLESKHNKEKQTLILIHGMNDEKDTWLPMAIQLRNEYHLILIDLLGCGESTLVMDFDYSLASQADFMQKVITQITNEKSIKSFSLAGHSMGGGLAIMVANKLPINKLILIASMGIHQIPSYFEKIAQEIGEIRKLSWIHICTVAKLKSLLKDSYYKMPYIPTVILKYFVEKKCALAELEEKKFRFIVDENIAPKDNLSLYLNKLRHETLILWGENDKSIHVDNAKIVHQGIPNNRLKVYPKCGHMPQYEKAKEVAKDISMFLNNPITVHTK